MRKKVWEKGQIVEGISPNLFRKDACGAWIRWDKYGVRDNIYGWEIDHIYPRERLERMGFKEDKIGNLSNLRPLQHENNASKADDYPSYTSVVTSEGYKNIHKEQNLVVNSTVRRILSELYSKREC